MLINKNLQKPFAINVITKIILINEIIVYETFKVVIKLITIVKKFAKI